MDDRWNHAFLEFEPEISQCLGVDLDESVPSCVKVEVRISSEMQNAWSAYTYL
jgi:hypothetical protein